jgi:hypothetical protein
MSEDDSGSEDGPPFECERCGKQFVIERARNGHESMCPENPDRRESMGWTGDGHR